MTNIMDVLNTEEKYGVMTETVPELDVKMGKLDKEKGLIERTMQTLRETTLTKDAEAKNRITVEKAKQALIVLEDSVLDENKPVIDRLKDELDGITLDREFMITALAIILNNPQDRLISNRQGWSKFWDFLHSWKRKGNK
mgnify:CR=1 FL=1